MGWCIWAIMARNRGIGEMESIEIKAKMISELFLSLRLAHLRSKTPQKEEV